MDVSAILDALGFDFVLLGAVAGLGLIIAWGLYWEEAGSLKGVLDSAAKIFGGDIGKGALACFVAIAVLAGMYANVAADKVFDFDLKQPVAGAAQARAREACTDPELTGLEAWIRSEDSLKQDAIREVCSALGDETEARAFLIKFTTDSGAKRFVQHAAAIIARKASSATNAALRTEASVMKVLRLCCLSIVFAIVALIIGPIRRSMVQTIFGWYPRRLLVGVAMKGAQAIGTVSNFDREDVVAPTPGGFADILRRHLRTLASADRYPTTGRTRPSIVPSLLSLFLLVATFATTYALWSLQSVRYYKKLTYGYFVEEGIDMSVAGVAQYTNLAEIPGMLAHAIFENANPTTSELDMFEFSGLTTIGRRVFVVDNETNRLNRPFRNQTKLGGFRDPTGLAMFEVQLGREIASDGRSRLSLNLSRAWASEFARLPPGSWDDLEAVVFHDNALYAIGSHSLNSEGFLRRNRHVIVRLGVNDAGQSLERVPRVYADLMKALLREPARRVFGFTSSAAAPHIGAPADAVAYALNIEGLAVNPGTSGLLLALRAPLGAPIRNGDSKTAMIMAINNPDAIFDEKDSVPQLSDYAHLDLNGRGISELAWDARSKTFLLAAAPANESDPNDYSSLWQWDGRGSTPKELMRFGGHKLEGIALTTNPIDGREVVILAFDEEASGLPKQQFGRLLVIDRSRLQRPSGMADSTPAENP
jgi:hypothetical protein